eukprot:Amastigsp_a515007_38.p3 type:complete len:126 gc:universal Amastigsp_a515007_38:1-378(+)
MGSRTLCPPTRCADGYTAALTNTEERISRTGPFSSGSRRTFSCPLTWSSTWASTKPRRSPSCRRGSSSNADSSQARSAKPTTSASVSSQKRCARWTAGRVSPFTLEASVTSMRATPRAHRAEALC